MACGLRIKIVPRSVLDAPGEAVADAAVGAVVEAPLGGAAAAAPAPSDMVERVC